MNSPPGPRSRIPGRSIFSLGRDPLAFLSFIAREYGDFARVPVGRETLYVASEPELVREVLVTKQRHFHKGRGLERAKQLLGEGLLTSEGEAHLRQRRLAQPAFHRERIAGYARVMGAYASRHASRWRDGETMDAHAAMMALTLAIVGKTLFDADVENEASEIRDALATTLETFGGSLFSPFAALLDRLPLPRVRRFRRARARLDATIHRLIAERRASGRDHGDLLSMLMHARDDEGDGGAMSDIQLRDESMTLFLAGHETTANALTFAFHLVSRDAAVEQRLHDEVDALGARDVLDMDAMARLPYARMIVAETMRLYPPAWVIGRRVVTPLALGGYEIPTRAIVVVAPWIVHRDARWFPDPLRFDPERWRADVASTRPKFSYFPFGGGTRVCIGESFAWTEAVLVLATIARRWRLRATSSAEPGLAPSVTLRPKNGLSLRLERR